MDGMVIGPVLLILVIGACIVIPIWLRHRLYTKQLETIAAAIEHGIPPEEIRRSIALPTKAGDINGNWKAGVILLGLGIGMFLLGLPDALSATGREWYQVLIVALLGLVLLVIHFTIVGRVIRVGEEQLTSTGRDSAQL